MGGSIVPTAVRVDVRTSTYFAVLVVTGQSTNPGLSRVAHTVGNALGLAATSAALPQTLATSDF
jgi:hypothetical protein